MTDYYTATQLAEKTGFTSRYFQRLASEKKIRWAYQPNGPRGGWRFEREGFESWWGKDKKTWRASTKEGKRGGRVSRSAVKSTGSPLGQLLNELRASGC